MYFEYSFIWMETKRFISIDMENKMREKKELLNRSYPFDLRMKWGYSYYCKLRTIEQHQLTDNMNISELCFGCDRVDLAHVSSMIFFLDIVYMKKPCSMLIMFIMRYWDPWIPSDYMIVNGQNCWLFEMYPGNLQKSQQKKTKISINDSC